MEKNTVWAIVLSMLFLMIWWSFFQSPAPKNVPAPHAAPQSVMPGPSAPRPATPAPSIASAPGEEKEIVVDARNYKAVFTTRGAAVKHWYLKEQDGTLTDLVLGNETPLATYPGSLYNVTQNGRVITFTHDSPQGWRITKTYSLSEDYLHAVNMAITKTKASAVQPAVQIDWGPGLGTDEKEQKENLSVIRTIGFTDAKPYELRKFKPGEYAAEEFQWIGVDNRYFLAAFVPSKDSAFNTVSVYRESKKLPAGIMLSATRPQDVPTQNYTVQFYLGPKGHEHLAALNLNLEESIDFGFFGFLGKAALRVLLFFHDLTKNYGWSIIILTIIIQILVLPLTIKSFKASAAMKSLQPKIRALQEKYKEDPKRLNVEMLNLYRTQKVNPLGGCLPMLLQLPIFWALFTTLRNAYELRNAPWILWVKDLSAPDTLFYLAGLPINILPLIMGVGMLVQQRMVSISTDPMQQKLMYFMPVIFTFMFWGFPSGLVIYWLTNSIITIIEQYIIMNRQETAAAN